MLSMLFYLEHAQGRLLACLRSSNLIYPHPAVRGRRSRASGCLACGWDSLAPLVLRLDFVEAKCPTQDGVASGHLIGVDGVPDPLAIPLF